MPGRGLQTAFAVGHGGAPSRCARRARCAGSRGRRARAAALG
ncbi:hypothetical protein BURPS305_6033 [Burkholderia pseudomallei 305]|nr:hypothetical protein BURPS305_6033 [Burkholderia pseudomallei 305]